MSLSHNELAALVEELDASTPAGVQKVFERDENGFVLQLRGGGATSYLLVDSRPGATRTHFVQGKPRQPQHPSAFVMLLRKHLIGTGLRSVSLDPDDRLVIYEFERTSEEGARSRTLVAELTGKRSAVALLDDEGTVLGGRLTDAMPRAAGLRVGQPWVRPPVAPEQETGDVRWGLDELPVGSRSEVVEERYGELVEERDLVRQRRELSRSLASTAKRLRRLQKNVEGDLERAVEAQSYQRRAELLKSAYGKVERGAEAVDVPDYYAEGAPLVTIELDPSRSLQGNIDRYFHEYRRLHEATDRIESRLLAVMEESEQLESLRAELREADDDALDEIEERARSAGFVRSPQQGKSRRGGEGRRLPYREFRTRKGSAVLVGRGAKHNDELTTRYARGRDIWLHARDWPGSHVVLRMNSDDEPDGDELLDAAVLAAHFSKGRGDTLIDVTHTRAKHVRKPKGFPPGKVTVGGGSTLAVAEDPERLERLLATESSR